MIATSARLGNATGSGLSVLGSKFSVRRSELSVLARRPGTVSHQYGYSFTSVPRSVHVLDDRVTELSGADLRGALHQPREVVGHPPAADRAVYPLDDQIRGLDPPDVPEHHLAGQRNGSRVHLVKVRVLRRRAMGRLEHGVAGQIVDVAARCDSDATDLRRERVRQIIAVEIQ